MTGSGLSGSVGLGDTTLTYLDLDISFFDMMGNSNDTYQYYETERIADFKKTGS